MVTNRLATLRKARGFGATELARAAGLSRQAIHAMESGSFVPNTAVALRLASILGVTVEELFSLEEPVPDNAKHIRADRFPGRQAEGSPLVRLCQVGRQILAVPVEPAAAQFPESDGMALTPPGNDRVDVELWDEWKPGRQLLIAGCDPAVMVLRKGLAAAGIDLIPWNCNSSQALHFLDQGQAHIAGYHLTNDAGEQNLNVANSVLGSAEVSVVRFATWEQGIVVAPGNPLEIYGIVDLARSGTRLRNRESGSGSRALLDRLLHAAGITPALLAGYDSLTGGHLAAARAVFSGEADACIATRAAARAFSLDFVPLVREDYNFFIPKKTIKEPNVEVCLDLLHRASLRRELGRFAGYETGSTGKFV